MYIELLILWCSINRANAGVVTGCLDSNAHNYDPAATVDIQNCQYCNDGKQNGDEEGIDCGGTNVNCPACDTCLTTYGCQMSWRGDGSCDSSCNNVPCDFDSGDCVVGCTDPAAHNFNAYATVSINNCELCDDSKLNGDEEGIDCGGTNSNCTACDTCDTLHGCPKSWRGNGECDQLCNNDDCDTDGKDCVIGCTNSSAHNYNPDAKFDDYSCTFCTDGIANADEVGVDCGGSLCRPCIFGCLDDAAHNFVDGDIHVDNCEFCWDNITNGDEQGVDCGGDNAFCDPCLFGCMNDVAHNFDVNATGHNESICEYCFDGMMNGDEWGIDCGGSHPDCGECVWGCMDPDAHNFNPNATGYNDTIGCDYCTDGIRNADELGIDCWSDHPLCAECVPGCMDPTAHNFDPNATIEMHPNHTDPEDYYEFYRHEDDDDMDYAHDMNDTFMNNTDVNITDTNSTDLYGIAFMNYSDYQRFPPVCTYCSDGVMNGDELGIDCGGSNPLCIPCVPGCMEFDAHNFDPNATQNVHEMCDTCHDGLMNADEEGIDCGGNNTHCPECDFGCMNITAHNYDPKATTSTEWVCEYCDDGMQNGDEDGIDCDSASNPLCVQCIYGCMDPRAHNFLGIATAEGHCETCWDGAMNGNEEGVDCGGSNPACGPCIPAGEECGPRNDTVSRPPCIWPTMCVKNYTDDGYSRAACEEDDMPDDCLCAHPWCSDRNASNYHVPQFGMNSTHPPDHNNERRQLQTNREVEKTAYKAPRRLEAVPRKMEEFDEEIVPLYVRVGRTLEESGDHDVWNDTDWNDTMWNDTDWNDTMWNDTDWNDTMWNDTDWNDTMWNDTMWNDTMGNDTMWNDTMWEDESGDVEEDLLLFDMCVYCNDGLRNGDEEGIDCGGSDPRCPPCELTCSDPHAHNFFIAPNGSIGTKEHCETCYDNVTNGDELALDCGGKCRPCATYCLNMDAHNMKYEVVNETTMVEHCELCTDGVLNGDEEAVDCGGARCQAECDDCAREHSCALWQRGNVKCDANCMFPLCNWDDNDCESCTKQFFCRLEWIGDKTCQPECNHDVCQRDKGDCDECAVQHGCHLLSRANGVCDSDCNAELCNWDDGDCTFGCMDPIAHNFDATAHNDDGSCATCADGVMNWDEEGADCGGASCRACNLGCTDQNAHNYDSVSDVDDGSCATCYDKIINGDETDTDCGGDLCVPCIFGCMNRQAHNYLDIAEFDDGSCLTCSDNVKNGDEDGVDCGGTNPLCLACFGCTDAAAHNFVEYATVNNGQCETCTDRRQNGDEVLIDCGGALCPACVYGCMDRAAHNYVATAHAGDGSCLTCSDGLQNGDETAVDCGGSKCASCVGCMDPQAHNYFAPATRAAPCETCEDSVRNGDEEHVDCGGDTCPPCKWGCTNPRAHNYNETYELDDGGCETCSDNLENGDEEAIDCGGAMCTACITGCMEAVAHNFNPRAKLADGSCLTCSDGVQNGDEEDIDCGGLVCAVCEYQSTSGRIVSNVPSGVVVDTQYLMEVATAVQTSLVATLRVDKANVQVQVEVDNVQTRRLQTGTPQMTRVTHLIEERVEEGSSSVTRRDRKRSRPPPLLWNRAEVVAPNSTAHGRQLGSTQVLNSWYTVKDVVKATMDTVKNIVNDTNTFQGSFQESMLSSGFEITVTGSDKCELMDCDICDTAYASKCKQCVAGFTPDDAGQCVKAQDGGWCTVSNCDECEAELSFRCGKCTHGFVLANGQCLPVNNNGTLTSWRPVSGWLVRDTSCVPKVALLTVVRGAIEQCQDECSQMRSCAAFMHWTTGSISRCTLLWEVCGDSGIRGIGTVHLKFTPCTCSYGTAEKWGGATGLCTADGSEVCIRCRPKYHVSSNRTCEPNACTCVHGEPVPPWLCDVHAANVCDKCNEGYENQGTECVVKEVEVVVVEETTDVTTIVLAVCVPLAMVFAILIYCWHIGKASRKISPEEEKKVQVIKDSASRDANVVDRKRLYLQQKLETQEDLAKKKNPSTDLKTFRKQATGSQSLQLSAIRDAKVRALPGSSDDK